MTEFEMVQRVASHLREMDCTVALEVPFMHRSIDLVFEDRFDRIVAVECKRHDWSRAIEQATTHLLGADLVYICLPKRRPSGQLIAALDEHGIGLLLYDGDDPVSLHVYKEARATTLLLDFPKTWLRRAYSQRLCEGVTTDA